MCSTFSDGGKDIREISRMGNLFNEQINESGTLSAEFGLDSVAKSDY